MKTQRTTRCLLRVILGTLVLGSSAGAGGSFRDDFRDGSIQDGSPVMWLAPEDAGSVGKMGECRVTPEGLHMTPAWPEQVQTSMTRWAKDAYGMWLYYTGSITMRAQVKIPETTIGHGPGPLLFARATKNGSYYLTIDRTNLFISVEGGPSQGRTWRYWMNGRLDETKDVMIQFDVIDVTDNAGKRTSRLEGRWWAPGQEMPVQPQVVGYDAQHEAGVIGIGAHSQNEPNKTTIFRWVEVIVEPVVDLNGDGTVDIDDLQRLIESWGQNDPGVDLVLDGVVDRRDLEVLMDYWQQDVNDPTLSAHWALDEAQGDLASDSTGLHDATLVGGPGWDPQGGQVDGALRLDGIDDCAVVPFVGNPAEGPFSVLAWVKGGAPGQGILAQQGGVNVLMADPATGAVMTELKSTGRSAGRPLSGAAIITDGNWHRVGFTWDGAARRLYVDDILAAEDTLAGLAACYSGLLIGCGSNKAPGTYWKGLIDDVRIYNRVVQP
jgi:Concanavalin A-like lectin/glucanases superfamily